MNGRALKAIIIICVLVALIWQACKKAYNPESITGFKSALIVEGVINPSGRTDIYLSRTLDVDDKVANKPELRATVSIVAENGNSISLVEAGNGQYSLATLTLNPTLKYRLKIKTQAAEEYESTLMTVLTTPPIDALAWDRTPTGLNIHISTHDPQNKTRYYQWDYVEDWEIRSIDSAIYGQRNTTSVSPRPKAEVALMHTCYKKQRSGNILISSTAQLTNDVISKFPLVRITAGDDRLSIRYAMNVRQYAITREAFDYLTIMKRNSEQQGSFFDAQPSELTGNIRNVKNTGDIAIGYVVIAPVLERRIYIVPFDVPGWGFRLNCNEKLIANHPDTIRLYLSAGYVPHIPAQNASGAVIGWNIVSEICLDCRTRNGGNVKPSYW